jgi:sugar lactone lactonase YvrE
MKVPRGITLRNGKMYIADYLGPTVGELDLATGGYRLIEARGEEGPVPYVHPGDVQFGPDGLLYVVNNGMGNHALYGMTLDGLLQKRIALAGKADISAGLRFRPDGSILIADMRRALVLGYGPDGGELLMESAGEGDKGLNNVTGLEVDAGGTIYAFEMSGFRVQVLGPDGRFVRDYKLKCQPMYGAIRDGWLEVTCERGLMSVNLETGYTQPSRFAEGSSTMPGMLGVTYGPDGTLYIVHDGALHAYRVQH